MNKYKVGQHIPREGKTPLVVFECMEDGRYLARTMLQTIKADSITVDGRAPQPNDIVQLPNGKVVIFIGPNPTRPGRWDLAYQDRIEITEKEIEEALADLCARQIFSSVATKSERGGNSPNIRYLPSRTD